MIDFSDTIVGTPACDMCDGPLGRGRYAHVEGAVIYTLCSEECCRAAVREQRAESWAARRRATKRFVIGMVLLGAFFAPHEGPARMRPAAPGPVVDDLGPLALPAGWYGPVWPPTEMTLLAALGQDAWVHPLAGPFRRMPRADSRVFGAVRPGERPAECRNGHCGVDLGGEIWGEHIHAVHDGVVDFIQRAQNAQHGGKFVRLSHRNGTVFTWYFHLAAIPRELERGMPIKGGDVVGLLGDSGVKQSAPHLHFAMTMRPAKDWPEKYVDPEPLIALWPLRVPIDGSEVGLVTTVGPPAVPLGSATLRGGAAAAKRKLASQKRGSGDAAKSEENSAESIEAPPMDIDPDSEAEPSESSSSSTGE